MVFTNDNEESSTVTRCIICMGKGEDKSLGLSMIDCVCLKVDVEVAGFQHRELK